MGFKISIQKGWYLHFWYGVLFVSNQIFASNHLQQRYFYAPSPLKQPAMRETNQSGSVLSSYKLSIAKTNDESAFLRWRLTRCIFFFFVETTLTLSPTTATERKINSQAVLLCSGCKISISASGFGLSSRGTIHKTSAVMWGVLFSLSARDQFLSDFYNWKICIVL